MKENLIAFLLNGIWGELGLEDYLAIVGIVTNETGESNEPMMRILAVVCIAKLLLYCLACCNCKRQL